MTHTVVKARDYRLHPYTLHRHLRLMLKKGVVEGNARRRAETTSECQAWSLETTLQRPLQESLQRLKLEDSAGMGTSVLWCPDAPPQHASRVRPGKTGTDTEEVGRVVREDPIRPCGSQLCAAAQGHWR